MLQLGAQLEAEGYRVRYTSSQRRQVWRLLDMLWTVFKYRRQTALVLLDTYGTLNFYYAVLVSLLCRALQLPYIPILHGGTLPKRLETSPRKSALIFKHAKLLVSPSLYFVEAFKQHNYHNLRFIPNTIEIDNYPMATKSYESIRLLWVRSFSKIYNPCMAVYLLKQLQDQGHKASLTMVGPDSDGSLKTVQALATELKVKVNFTGKLSKPEWIALAKDHNIFINTTNFDNMPVSVIEAMALGLPVVSTAVGGMPYLIEDGIDGVLVPVNDVTAMAEAILGLQFNPDLAHVIAARARVKAEGFDWAVVRERWVAVLEGV